ncbi:MAG: phosphoribosylformylglycinamidine cyclo-ligase [Candidatus Izemoplasmatales bacterium]
MSDRYAKAGVDLSRGYEVVNRIKPYAKKTFRAGVLGDIGSFGGLFQLDHTKYHEPVLVSGTDGVGTKLLLAGELKQFDTVGIDLVAMSVNDVASMGAEPLFFLDYIACGQIDPDQIESLIKGIHQGCLEANCALIGGETAEMPGLYQKGHVDLAGFCVGVAEKSKLITGKDIQPGDLVLGLSSSGIHSNGYSLVRQILAAHPEIDYDTSLPELRETPREALLKPTRIYVKILLALQEQIRIKGIAHITGGGFYENLPRMFPEGLGIAIEQKQISIPPVFHWLKKMGNLDLNEMYRVFNMGLGLAMVIDESECSKGLDVCKTLGFEARVVGEITATPGVFLR